MKTQDSLDLPEIWELYQRDRSIRYRDILIQSYLHLVKNVVHRLIVGMPAHVQAEDLYASGIEGLIRAVERYDPSRGSRFESYALLVIKGAIIDDLRKQDWVPRSVYQKAHKLTEAIESLRQSLGKEPTDGDLCEYFNITQRELSSWFSASRPALVISLNEDPVFQQDGERGVALGERIPDEKAETGFEFVDKQEFAAYLANAISGLEEKEQQVMILYYYEELILKDIGKILGVSESRVSQIHAKALIKLRIALSNIF